MNMKGSLPLLILHVLSKGPCHGYRIAKSIKLASDGVLDFREGTLYPTLHKMEKQGAIEAYEEMENGRKRRYYRITKVGRGNLARQREAWANYAQAVETVLGKFSWL